MDVGRFHEAAPRFDEAIAIAREMRDDRHQGQFLGYLGLLRARENRPDLARAALTQGETLLRAASDPLSLAILLCGRAEAELLAGDLVAARAAFEEAQGIAEATGAGEKSELGVALSRIQLPVPSRAEREPTH